MAITDFICSGCNMDTHIYYRCSHAGPPWLSLTLSAVAATHIDYRYINLRFFISLLPYGPWQPYSPVLPNLSPSLQVFILYRSFSALLSASSCPLQPLSSTLSLFFSCPLTMCRIQFIFHRRIVSTVVRFFHFSQNLFVCSVHTVT